MTEEEWLTATDPTRMLSHLRAGMSLRKLRLFGCECCRTVWRLLPDIRSRRAVEVAEQFADGLATETEAESAGFDAAEVNGHELSGLHPAMGWRASTAAAHLLPEDGDLWQLRGVWSYVATALEAEHLVANGATDEMLEAWSEQSVESGRPMGWTDIDSGMVAAELFRDIFGNPFRPVAVDPSWLTPTVAALADAIYADRAFDRLPVLADALEEAGCDHPDVLAHCRGDGPHVKGCWVVDLVLRKG